MDQWITRRIEQWTWAATILQSSNVAWQYGVSGPFWYASGATIQVLLFGVMAIEIKRKAPNAHTVCEIVRARWGRAAHAVFLVFCLATNVIVTAMLLLGVVVYMLAGGLKATFLTSYIHSVVVLVVFVFLVYTSSHRLGSPRANCDPGGRAPGWRCFGEPRLRRPRPCLAALRRAALPVTAPPAPRPGELRPR